MYLLSFYGSIRTVDKNEEVTWSVVRWQKFHGYEITTSFETKATTTHSQGFFNFYDSTTMDKFWD
jgi:hypothetical protein